MLTDGYGLSLSTNSHAARDAYHQGCALVLTLYPGARVAFERAIAADPAFALAHAGLARAMQVAGDIPGAKAAIAAAETRVDGSAEREAGHVATLALLVGGRPAAALEAVRKHVTAWPRDALIVSLAANQTGLIGMSGRADREQDQLDFLAALAPHYGDDWWFDSHYAMALSELGHASMARPRVERSLAVHPRNAYAAHAFAHLGYETGETEATAAFLRGWLADYPRDGTMYGHLSWHLALAHLELGDLAEGMRLYAEAFAAEDYPGPALLKVLDAPSFLWRVELAGHPRDNARWRELRDFVRRSFPRPGMPFADWHIALVDAVIEDAATADAREAALDELVRDGRYPAGTTVLALARGFAAFERRDFAAAIDAFRSMFDERARISGSRAQIDLVEFTLLKAYLETGRRDEARRLLQARGTRAPGVPVAGVEAALQPVHSPTRIH